jgi:SAM-dependent methyltransferase
MVTFASGRGGHVQYLHGDAHALDFDDARFDVTVCHFLLMWCRDPQRAAEEMVRVTRPGGSVLVCAEPDYGGRIDHPPLPLGSWQMEALRLEGADPCLGRKLRHLFDLPGVRQIDVGLVPGIWDLAQMRSEFEDEWTLWERTLKGLVPDKDLQQVKAADLRAVEVGERFVFVPVFFAMVRV